jgi:hypothetical protein
MFPAPYRSFEFQIFVSQYSASDDDLMQKENQAMCTHDDTRETAATGGDRVGVAHDASLINTVGVISEWHAEPSAKAGGRLKVVALVLYRGRVYPPDVSMAAESYTEAGDDGERILYAPAISVPEGVGATLWSSSEQVRIAGMPTTVDLASRFVPYAQCPSQVQVMLLSHANRMFERLMHDMGRLDG